jgi:murein DD-endopeptidase MepM/ murein hydrolase activator NlpD
MVSGISQAAASLTADIFGKQFPLYRGDKPGLWEGLIGIDLDTEPGEYVVRIQGTESAGESIFLEHHLEIRAKTFDTRRLRVDEKYVNPPAEVLDRIRRESETVRKIFSDLSPERLWRGTFRRPVPGAVISTFGKRSILNDQPRSPHTGIDLRGATGTPIKAPNRGRVVLAADLYYSGKTVIMDHGLGLFSYFAHLSRLSVREGDIVPGGTVIGAVGATGRVSGPHLHWTVRLLDTRIDPLSLMSAVAQPGARKPGTSRVNKVGSRDRP